MEVHIRTPNAADAAIRSREQLALLLEVEVDFIESVVSNPEAFYTSFSIPKSNGLSREIKPPTKCLRRVQRTLLNLLYDRVVLRSCLHGGVPRKSIVTHAQSHLGRAMLATLDIRDFYPSTTLEHLRQVATALGFVDEAATDLLLLVTLNGRLPQGAPTSSLFANLAFAPGDTEFIDICRNRGRRRWNLRYSRYVDDIAISGDCDLREMRDEFVRAIGTANYTVADEKIHFKGRHERQIVTGLVVNDKLRPTKEYIRDLKHDIRNCLNLGAALVAIAEGVTVRTLKNQLSGKVAHLSRVDRELGRHFHGMMCGVDWTSRVPAA
ncbi:MAG: reverse transcriptase family protein [Pirellulales bacterium]